MAILAPAALKPYHAWVQVQLIVDYHDVGRRDVEELGQRRNRTTRQIHVGPGLSQNHLSLAAIGGLKPSLHNLSVGLLMHAKRRRHRRSAAG